MKFLRWGVVVLGLLLMMPRPVLAHIYVEDGAIGILLHVNPDDENVITKQTSELNFILKDSEGKFKAANCDCQVIIAIGGKKLLTHTIFDDTPDSIFTIIKYVFPKSGDYEITVTGTPKDGGGFHAFTTVFNQSVAKAPEPPAPPWQHYVLPGVLGTGGLFAAGTGLLLARKRK
jgi:hypothetical protein